MNKYILNIQSNKKRLNQDLLFKNASLLLISVTTYCSEVIKKNIRTFNNIEEIKLDKFVYTEFLYFYIHAMLITADIISLTEFQKIKLRMYLEKTIATYASGYFGETKTDSWKENYISAFINSLHEKEDDYNKFSDLQTKDIIPEVHFLSLFSRLAQNITSILDKKEEKETILLLTYEVSTKEWAKMDPTELLVKFKQLS